MSVDHQPREISRRSIAKGAAWAAPAAVVAGAAPTMAASPLAPCTPTNGSVTLTRNRCQAIGVGQPPFWRIRTDACTFSTGQVVAITSDAFVGLTLDPIRDSNFQFLRVVGNTALYTMTAPLGPGQSRDIPVISLSWLGSSTSISQTSTIRLYAPGCGPEGDPQYSCSTVLATSSMTWTYTCSGILGCLFTCR